MHKLLLSLYLFVCLSLPTFAQDAPQKFIQPLVKDSAFLVNSMNMDATYNRPFLSVGKLPIAIGGYAEANLQHSITDGIGQGVSFQARRFTLFFSSTIAQKIKFLSELEFEDGTKEINIEFAACDFEFHPLLNFRGGIIMNPIGAFNQNHDGPKWDFIDRPLVSTTLIPSTLSNAGFGFHGKYFSRHLIVGYEIYATNGFDERIVSNNSNRTSLAAGKINPFRFEESSNGSPMMTGKIALRNRKIGELGISYLTGVYNQFNVDGFKVDSKRSASIFAIDFNTSLFKDRFFITGELAQLVVDIPSTYIQNYGTKQQGAFLDLIATVVQRPIAGWERAKFNAGIRIEYVDYNQGRFRETNESIGDQQWALVPTIAFRPNGNTVIRMNYRFIEETDLLNTPKSYSSVFQFGISTYF
jgi:hypothetical protein